MARTFKRDRRGRFATVDSRGDGSAKDRRIEEREQRLADKESRKFDIQAAEAAVRRARVEKKIAETEYKQLRKFASVEGAVYDDYLERVQDAIAALSKASIKLNQLKRSR